MEAYHFHFDTHELLEDFIEFMRDSIRNCGGFSINDVNEYFGKSTDIVKDNEYGWVSFSRIKYDFDENGTGWCYLPTPLPLTIEDSKAKG